MELKYCFLDMDGVLADFVAGACCAHGVEVPYGKPENYGVFELEKLLKLSGEEFWGKVDVPGFWESLPRVSFADELVSGLLKEFSVDRICILTSPSLGASCIPEKRKWMRRHYPFFEKNMMFGCGKRFLAGPDRLLIDDQNENVDSFVAAGGVAVQVPQPWNRLSDFHKYSVHYVLGEVEYIKMRG